MIVLCAYRVPEGRKGRPCPGGVSFRMPGAPYTNWLVLGFLLLVAVLLGFDQRHAHRSLRSPVLVRNPGGGLLRIKARLLVNTENPY